MADVVVTEIDVKSVVASQEGGVQIKFNPEKGIHEGAPVVNLQL